MYHKANISFGKRHANDTRSIKEVQIDTGLSASPTSKAINQGQGSANNEHRENLAYRRAFHQILPSNTEKSRPSCKKALINRPKYGTINLANPGGSHGKR